MDQGVFLTVAEEKGVCDLWGGVDEVLGGGLIGWGRERT